MRLNKLSEEAWDVNKDQESKPNDSNNENNSEQP